MESSMASTASIEVDFKSQPLDKAIQQAKGHYERDGAFLAKGLLTDADLRPMHDDISKLVQILFENLGKTRKSSGGQFDDGVVELAKFDRSQIGKLFDAGKRMLPMHQLTVNERMVELSRSLMGTDTIAASDHKAMRIDLPNEDKYLFDWHQDYPYIMDSMDAVVFWIPLQDVDEKNGALTVALGSHKHGVEPLILLDATNSIDNKQKVMKIANPDAPLRYERLKVPMKFGDVLVFSTLCLHQSGPNLSDRARFTIQARFGNFRHPVAIDKGWPGSMNGGGVFHEMHPEYITKEAAPLAS
jgi:hypothetical protein